MNGRRNHYPEIPEYVRYCRALVRQRVVSPLYNGIPQLGAPEIQDGYWEGTYYDTSIGRISKQRFHLIKFSGDKYPEGYRSYRLPKIAQSKWYVVDDQQVHPQGFDTKKEAVAVGSGEVLRGAMILEDPRYCRKLTVEFFL
jgi:hypothetical protein